MEGQRLRLSPTPSSERKVRSISISNPEHCSTLDKTADAVPANHDTATAKSDSAIPSHNSNVKASPPSWSKDRKRPSSTVEVVKGSRSISQIKRKHQDPVLLQARLRLTKTGRVAESNPRLLGRGQEMRGEQASKRTQRDNTSTAVERDSHTAHVQLTPPTCVSPSLTYVRPTRTQLPIAKSPRTFSGSTASVQTNRQALTQPRPVQGSPSPEQRGNSSGETLSHFDPAGPAVSCSGSVGLQRSDRGHPDLLRHMRGEATSM